MDKNNSSVKGVLKISEDVIITVARLAASDVKGVAGLKDSSDCIFKKNNAIKISMMGDVVAISVSIIVNSDERASTVAAKVQNAVKENVQNMTGVTVARVNVIVAGIEF
ncbi:MAG: Asp23/Gls24 family envelope stress response protein [Ruminococcus sp.]|nr:Asp23/Gls24 family envelope stress response protein [Ruminococcus sp.]